MIGMLMKELYVMKSIGKSYLLVVLIFGALAATGVYNLSFFSAMCGMLLITMPMTGFAYDEQAGWDKYAASTPAGRRGVVRGKYLFSLALWLAVMVLTLLFFSVVTLASSKEISAGVDMLQGVAVTSLGLLMVDILLPILFKFGSQKGRVILMLVVGVTVGATVAALSLFRNMSDSVQTFQSGLSLASILLPVLVLGGFAISYFTSLAIYQKKEL